MRVDNVPRFGSTGHGWNMEFANGWSISVQFGRGAYCHNHGKEDIGEHGQVTSPSAEIAIFDATGNFHRPQVPAWDTDDDVLGWQNPDRVAYWISYVVKQ